jgi:hypothetical protein
VMSNFFRDDKRAIQLEGPRHVKKNTYSYYIVVSRLKRLPCYCHGCGFPVVTNPELFRDCHNLYSNHILTIAKSIVKYNCVHVKKNVAEGDYVFCWLKSLTFYMDMSALTPAFRRTRRALTRSTNVAKPPAVYKRAIISKLPSAVGVACKVLLALFLRQTFAFISPYPLLYTVAINSIESIQRIQGYICQVFNS